MYEKVLFPTDFSEYTQKTLECIGDIPGIKDIVLLHVVDATQYSVYGWTHEKEVEDAKIRLDEQKQHLEGFGLKVKWRVEVITSSNVTNEILKIAEEEKVSLIVMNARGKSPVSGLLLGSISMDVIRHTATDVLIMRHKIAEGLEGEKFEKFCSRILSKVLYPTDFSVPTGNTLSFLKNLGVQDIVLMHVVTEGNTKEDIDNYVKNARDRLEAIKDIENLNIDMHVRIGDPTEEICSVAEDTDVSMIAMYSHSRNWLDELLIGSTTFDVLERAKRPVLIMRNK